MSDTISPAFADPAKYDLYDCKQLETERKSLATRTAELQGLMAKAETGVGGSVVAEVAYRNDYIAVRGQSKLAEEAWRRNNVPGIAAVRPRRRRRPLRQPSRPRRARPNDRAARLIRAVAPRHRTQRAHTRQS